MPSCVRNAAVMPLNRQDRVRTSVTAPVLQTKRRSYWPKITDKAEPSQTPGGWPGSYFHPQRTNQITLPRASLIIYLFIYLENFHMFISAKLMTYARSKTSNAPQA